MRNAPPQLKGLVHYKAALGQSAGYGKPEKRLLIGAGGLRPFALGGSKCKPVGSYFIPPLYQKAVRLEELADSGSLPAYNFLQDRHKYGVRIGAEHRSFCDLGDIFALRNCDGEAVAHIHVQHHVDIGTAVANIDDLVRADLQSGLQLIEYGDLPVTSSGPIDGLDLPRSVETKLSSIDMIDGYDPFQRRLNNLDGSVTIPLEK